MVTKGFLRCDAMRGVMAIGVFLDNEIMYDRALRYLQGAPSRADDIPYTYLAPLSQTLKLPRMSTSMNFDEPVQQILSLTMDATK